MRFTELIPVVQMAVGPVILISGIGLLILSMTNRFGRVIDRTRLFADALRKSGAENPDRYTPQMEVLRARARILRTAITLSVMSVLCAALMVMTIFLTAMLNLSVTLPIVILFFGSMLFLIASLLFFIRDLNLSLEALDLEIG
jgi:hypothetical protein